MIQPTHHYVGRCKTCGVAIACVYDMAEYPADTASTVENMIRRGLSVERVPVGSVTFPMAGCQCARNPVSDLPLFAQVTP